MKKATLMLAGLPLEEALERIESEQDCTRELQPTKWQHEYAETLESINVPM